MTWESWRTFTYCKQRIHLQWTKHQFLDLKQPCESLDRKTPFLHCSGTWKTINYKVPSHNLWTEKVWKSGMTLMFLFFLLAVVFNMLMHQLFLQDIRESVPFLLHLVMQWCFLQSIYWDSTSYCLYQEEAWQKYSHGNHAWCHWRNLTCPYCDFYFSIIVHEERKNWNHIFRK